MGVGRSGLCQFTQSQLNTFFFFFLIMFLELLLSSFYNVAVQLVLRVLFPWSVLSLLQLWHPSPI